MAMVRTLKPTRRGLLGCFVATVTTAFSRAADSSVDSSAKFRLSLPPLEPDFKRLYLIRHGETDWNLEGRIQGLTDKALNEAGLKQAVALSDALADVPLEHIASSSLTRASTTADVVARHHPSAKRSKEKAFVEMCFGDYEGMLLSEIDDDYKQYLRAWRGGTDKAFPGERGESPNAVARRGLAGLRALGLLGEGPSGGERHVCVVAHGRFNKILIAALQGDITTASDLKQGNTCINVLDLGLDGSCIVRALDVRDHLRELQTTGRS
jgi:broad specificity phosphatase PhoE